MGISEKPWSAFESQAQERLETARQRYGDHGFRMEAAETEGEEGGDDGSAGEIFQSPEVQDAIRQAKIRGRDQALKEAKEREKGLLNNRDAIKGEKLEMKSWIDSLGGKEEIETTVEQFKKLKAMKIADETGLDPDKVQTVIEREAQTRFNKLREQEEKVVKAKDDRIAELEEKLATTEGLAQRNFAAERLVRAAMPEDLTLVTEGAWPYLLDAAKDLLVTAKDEATGREVVRVRSGSNGSWESGSGPGGYMTERELLDLARQGKGPLGHMRFCFASNGKGSGTHSVNTNSTTKPWSKMSPEEQTVYVNEHTQAQVQEFIDAG